MTQFQKEQRINGNAGTVTVQGVQLEDEGDYECNILHMSDGREETTTHELVVRIKVKLCGLVLISGRKKEWWE